MDAIEKESLLLYKLCGIIGLSSRQRKKNIQLANCETTVANIDFTNDSTAITMILCGSRSEGIYIFPKISYYLGTSSDVDCMGMVSVINVQEQVDTRNTHQTEGFQLLHTDSPEHVLLEVKYYESAYMAFSNSPNCWIQEVIKRKDDNDLISSSLLKDNFQRKFANYASFFPSSPVSSYQNLRYLDFEMHTALKNTTIHGPAVMTQESPLAVNVDCVFCFRCYEWPSAANEWVDRARPHGWPCQDLIDKIMNDGCELVAGGRKDHPDGDVEWKLSFSRAETLLIRNFNIYQAQCYQLLKIVKSFFISSVVPDSLSSYHIKTVMLHTVEQTEQKVWRKNNLVQCFMMCLSNLKRYLADKFLPQYFIVRQDLLEAKVTGDVHQKVLEIVTDLDKIGWKCILRCPLLQNMYEYMSIQETGDIIRCKNVIDAYELEGNKELIGCVCWSLFSVVLRPVGQMSYNSYLIGIVVFCEKPFLKPTSIHPCVETARVLQLLLKSELGLLLTVIRAMAHPDLRPGIKPLMNFALQCLEESCHADVSSCRLKCATFFFHHGEYDRCIATVQDVLERFKDVWFVLGRLGTNPDEIKEILRNVDTSKLEVKRNQVLQLSDNGFPFISNHLSLPAFFIRWEIAVAPKGVHFLQRKMPRPNRLMSESCCIDSIVYAHYLLLESYLKIEEYDHAEHALINMKESILNGKDEMFDRNCLCFCDEDNLLLTYSIRLMTVAKIVKDAKK